MNLCITRSQKFAYSETFIRDQIEGLGRLATVFTIHSGRYPEREEDGSLLSPKAYWLAHKALKTVIGRNNYFSDYGVKKFLQRHGIDVVIANYGISAVHMMPPCKALDIPLIPVFRGHDATDRRLLSQYAANYEALFSFAPFLVAVSSGIKSQLVHLGADPDKIHIIPSGVNTSKFKPSLEKPESKHFLAVGRFTPKKAPLNTLMAFRKVHERFPEATLTMAGHKDGLFPQVEELVAKSGLQEAVHFTGRLAHSDVSQLMKTALAFVQHSVTAANGDMEGTPVGIMEACASGLPVVSTFHGGIPDAVIHEKTGFLVKEGDVDQMARYMEVLCENPGLAKEMGLRGRRHMQEHYEQAEQYRRLYDLAERAMKQSGP
jgi:glycosyltransferase involved in cell wall biosynthesis